MNDGLQKIGNGAFFNCKALKSIKLPSTVVEIDNYAFNGCSKLKEVGIQEEEMKTDGMYFACSP